MEAKAARLEKTIRQEEKKVLKTQAIRAEWAREMEKVSKTTFADPLSYAVMQMIGTRSVTNVESLMRAFPKEAELDHFLGNIVNELEGAGVIQVQDDGEIHLTRLWVSMAKQFPEMQGVYPQLLGLAMGKVISDSKSGLSTQNVSLARVVSVTDSPGVRARIRRLRVMIDEEIAQIKQEAEQRPGRGFRTIAFLTTKMEGDDFL